MTAPQSYMEYLRRVTENQRMSGTGLETKTHFPCPFCGAPDFMIATVQETHEKLATGATCTECNRSAKGLLIRSPSSLNIEMVQTGGPDQPEWLKPPMRKLEE